MIHRIRQIVCLVPMEDVRLLEELENRLDLEDGRKALAEARKEGTVSHDALKKELGL